VHSNVDLLAWHLKRCVAGRPPATYMDLAGLSFRAFCPKVAAYMIPPEIQALYPEVLAGHVDTGTAAVPVRGRRAGGGAGGGGGGPLPQSQSFEERVDAAVSGVLGIGGGGGGGWPQGGRQRRAGLLGYLRGKVLGGA
jgi:hypothetical protein